MPLFPWEDRFSVGIPAIDAQHKHLVQLINDLHEGMRNGQANESMGNLLDRLVSYTQTHFATEERLIGAAGYPNMTEHRSEHQAFTNQVKVLAVEWRAGRVALSMKVFQFLKDWLKTHILVEDQRYVPFMQKSKPGVLTGAR